MSAPPPSVVLASCSDVVKTFNVDKQGTVTSRQDISVPHVEGPPIWHSVRWNHNNQVMACGGENGVIALLHESGKVLEVLREADGSVEPGSQSQYKQPVLSLAWGGRSRFLCTTGVNKCPSLWDLKKKARVRSFRGHRYPVNCVAFGVDDAHVASGNERGEVLLHQIRAEEAVSVLVPDSGDSAANNSARYWAMRPSYLLTGYENGVVRAWDVTTGDTVAAFRGQHHGAVNAVVGSTVNNKLMATGGADRRLILFDVNQRKLLKECKTMASITDMGFHPDGDMIAVGCTNGDVLVFDLRRAALPCITVNAHYPLPVRSISLQNPRKDKHASPTTTAAPISTTTPTTTTSSATSGNSASKSSAPYTNRQPSSTANSRTAEARPPPSSPAHSIASISSITSTVTSSVPPASPSPSGSHRSTTSSSVQANQGAVSTSPEASSTSASLAPPSKAPIEHNPPPPPPPSSFTESSFRWRDRPVSERKEEPPAATAATTGTGTLSSSAPPAAHPKEAAGVGMMMSRDGDSLEDAFMDLRLGIKRDVQALHIDMIGQFEVMRQSQEMLANRMQELTQENAFLRRELEGLRRAYS